jgi:hypothetical protein
MYSLSLEMIKDLIFTYFCNVECSAYSGNRAFVCELVVLYPFIVVYGMSVMYTQFVYVVKHWWLM